MQLMSKFSNSAIISLSNDESCDFLPSCDNCKLKIIILTNYTYKITKLYLNEKMYGYDTFILLDNVDMSTALLSSTKLFGGFMFVMREKLRPVIKK